MIEQDQEIFADIEFLQRLIPDYEWLRDPMNAYYAVLLYEADVRFMKKLEREPRLSRFLVLGGYMLWLKIHRSAVFENIDVHSLRCHCPSLSSNDREILSVCGEELALINKCVAETQNCIDKERLNGQ